MGTRSWKRLTLLTAQAAMQAVVSVKTYLNAHIPGLKQILDPIVGNIMKPVTEQVTSSAQSQTVDAAGTEIPQGLKGQVPLDAAACLNDALTYNLTNLLTDAITSMTTTKLCQHTDGETDARHCRVHNGYSPSFHS
jgi:hypothetical protein